MSCIITVKTLYQNLFFYVLILNLHHSLLQSFNASHVDYCKKELQCQVRSRVFPNTACQCPAENEKRCGGSPIVTKLSSNETLMNIVVDLHNKYREGIASGEETRLGNVGATDMMMLEYDTDLEYLAWCYSHKCNDEPDVCRRTPKFESSGQNQFVWFDGNDCDSSTLEDTVEMWYNEIDLMTQGRSAIITFNCDTEMVGRFTQMIWGRTISVGCALTNYFDRATSTNACNILCNYGPNGNRNQSRIYTLGTPARDCFETHHNFTSLCVGKVPPYGEHEVEGSPTVVTSWFLLWSSFFGVFLVRWFLVY
nr:venom allergen 5.02-like [Onthophagus taurus]